MLHRRASLRNFVQMEKLPAILQVDTVIVETNGPNESTDTPDSKIVTTRAAGVHWFTDRDLLFQSVILVSGVCSIKVNKSGYAII